MKKLISILLLSVLFVGAAPVGAAPLFPIQDTGGIILDDTFAEDGFSVVYFGTRNTSFDNISKNVTGEGTHTIVATVIASSACAGTPIGQEVWGACGALHAILGIKNTTNTTQNVYACFSGSMTGQHPTLPGVNYAPSLGPDYMQMPLPWETCYKEPTQLGPGSTAQYNINMGTMDGIGLRGIEFGYEWSLILSFEPIGECEDDYLQLTSDIYEIDPTIELPVGTPTDDQKVTTVIDQTYRIEISGGPWSDGTNTNRKDVAVSWDGITWTPFVSLPFECSQQDASGTVTVGFVIALSETFYIRVNDTAGAFANNTNNPDPMTYNIGIAVLQTGASCESQFSYDEGDDWVASVDVHGDDADGVLATSALVPGDWYTITVASGSWQDGGVPPDRYDMDYYNGPPEFTNFSIPYVNLTGGSSNTLCNSTDGMSAFIQATDEMLYLRVNDSNFTSNTGVLHVNIFHSTFTRSVDTCEMSYTKGDMIMSDSVQATQEAGKVFAFALGSTTISYGNALQPGAWYWLETSGGPWQWKGGGHSPGGIAYDMAVNDGDGWVALEDWARVDCVVKLDGLGHQGVYFQIPEVGDVEWKMRVNDDSIWFNNSGTMSWTLYGATDVGITPTDNCDFIYDPDHPTWGSWVSATEEDGQWMEIYPGNFYAITLRGDEYYWSETQGGPQLRAMQISTDDGQTWSDFPSGFAGSLCYTQAGNVVTTFIQAGQGQVWRIRVDSNSFLDNYGGMGYRIYAANAGDVIDPWTNCFDGNVTHSINPLTFIPVKEEAGLYINGTTMLDDGSGIQLLLQPTETYKVQIEEGPWTNGEGGQSYDAEISSDNGETWYAIDDKSNPGIICGDADFIGHHKSVYFTVQTGQKWKIRVADEAGAFNDNGGNLGYSLYTTSGEDVPPVFGTIPLEVINLCDAPLLRPQAPTEIIRWIEFGRLSVQKYLAWCKPHTNLVLSLLDLLKSKEPFATIIEWQGVIRNIKSEAEAYEWGSDSEDFSILDKSPGASYQMFNDHAFAQVENDNPWETGFIDIQSFQDFEMPSSYGACQDYLSPQAGRYLAQGVCYASSVMLMTGASFWIQLILDIGIAILCVRSFWGTVGDTVAMATGVARISKLD